MSEPTTCQNTDRKLWEAEPNEKFLFPPSIHVTATGGIGINVGGHVIVMNVEKWHALGRLRCALADLSP